MSRQRQVTYTETLKEGMTFLASETKTRSYGTWDHSRMVLRKVTRMPQQAPQDVNEEERLHQDYILIFDPVKKAGLLNSSKRVFGLGKAEVRISLRDVIAVSPAMEHLGQTFIMRLITRKRTLCAKMDSNKDLRSWIALIKGAMSLNAANEWRTLSIFHIYMASGQAVPEGDMLLRLCPDKPSSPPEEILIEDPLTPIIYYRIATSDLTDITHTACENQICLSVRWGTNDFNRLCFTCAAVRHLLPLLRNCARVSSTKVRTVSEGSEPSLANSLSASCIELSKSPLESTSPSATSPFNLRSPAMTPRNRSSLVSTASMADSLIAAMADLLSSERYGSTASLPAALSSSFVNTHHEYSVAGPPTLVSYQYRERTPPRTPPRTLPPSPSREHVPANEERFTLQRMPTSSFDSGNSDEYMDMTSGSNCATSTPLKPALKAQSPLNDSHSARLLSNASMVTQPDSASKRRRRYVDEDGKVIRTKSYLDLVNKEDGAAAVSLNGNEGLPAINVGVRSTEANSSTLPSRSGLKKKTLAEYKSYSEDETRQPVIALKGSELANIEAPRNRHSFAFEKIESDDHSTNRFVHFDDTAKISGGGYSCRSNSDLPLWKNKHKMEEIASARRHMLKQTSIIHSSVSSEDALFRNSSSQDSSVEDVNGPCSPSMDSGLGSSPSIHQEAIQEQTESAIRHVYVPVHYV